MTEIKIMGNVVVELTGDLVSSYVLEPDLLKNLEEDENGKFAEVKGYSTKGDLTLITNNRAFNVPMVRDGKRTAEAILHPTQMFYMMADRIYFNDLGQPFKVLVSEASKF